MILFDFVLQGTCFGPTSLRASRCELKSRPRVRSHGACQSLTGRANGTSPRTAPCLESVLALLETCVLDCWLGSWEKLKTTLAIPGSLTVTSSTGSLFERLLACPALKAELLRRVCAGQSSSPLRAGQIIVVVILKATGVVQLIGLVRSLAHARQCWKKPSYGPTASAAFCLYLPNNTPHKLLRPNASCRA